MEFDSQSQGLGGVDGDGDWDDVGARSGSGGGGLAEVAGGTVGRPEVGAVVDE